MTWAIFVVCLGFVACSSTITFYYVFMLLGDLDSTSTDFQVKFYYLGNSLCHFQNCADFFIYALMSKQYRAAYMLLARDICSKVKEIVMGQRTSVHSTTTVFIHKEVLQAKFNINKNSSKHLQSKQVQPRNIQISILVNDKKTTCRNKDHVTGTYQQIAGTTLVLVTKFQNETKIISRESVRRSSESEVSNFVQLDQSEFAAATFLAENKREFVTVSMPIQDESSLRLSVAISNSLIHQRKMSL